MSTSEVSPETPLDKGQRAEAAIPTNVRVYLGLCGKTQKALGEALGITKSAMSMKMCGKVGWSVSDLVTTADFLGVTPSALMDDTILSKADCAIHEPLPRTTSIKPLAMARPSAVRMDSGWNCNPKVGCST